MNGSIAALFGLIGFLIPLLVTSVLSSENDDKSPKIIEGSLKGKAIAILCITGAFCCLIMVLQGLHLWRSWEIPQIDSSEAATISTKARGRGGFILLIISFFPQFLVFGYGLWGWQLKPYIPKAIKLWG
jgi:hypothetical protein